MRPLTIRSALALALAAAATSGFATPSVPASANATADTTAFTGIHGMAVSKAAIANNRSFNPWPGRRDRIHRAVDTAFQGDPEDPNRPPTKFVGLIRDDRVLVRDPRTTPQWHDLTSLLPNNFGRLVDISLAAPDEGTTVHVTVLDKRGRVAESACTVFPTPGTMTTPRWPDNCTNFIDLMRH